MRAALGLVILTLACGVPADGSRPVDAAREAPEMDAQALAVEERCTVVFSPEESIAELAESAAEQWSEATGCDVRVGEGGVAIRFVERITNDAGDPQCGVTHRMRDESGAVVGARDIEISTNRVDRCRLTARDVLHEMGHGLAPRRGHTTEGLMAPVPNGIDYIDGVSAQFVSDELLSR